MPFSSRRPTTLLLVCSLVVVLASCTSKMQFEQTKKSEFKALTAIVAVKNYAVVFNPKANASIDITMGDGSIYKASQMSPAQLSSLLNLLSNKQLQFDTKNAEFILKQ